MSRAALLPPILLASGLAGLGYELIWTRMLSGALGQEMLAVLGVVAAFFLGLALGGFLLDGPIRRAARPRRAYAALEAVIGLWALASIWLLPAAGRLVPALLGADAAGARHWAVAFGLPALLLLPATLAMGGTLAALERIAANLRRQGRGVAGLYGANTLGAVIGALAGIFLLAPWLGLSGSLAALALCNFACVVGALLLGPEADGAAAAPPDSILSAPGMARLGASLFATGLLGVAFEVLAVRVASQVLENTVYSFACLLAVYLLGTAIGGFADQRFGRGAPAGPARLALLLGLATLACLSAVAALPLLPALVAATRGFGLLAPELAVAAALFLLPTIAMGALFGDLAQRARDARGSLGRATGINALGAAIAPAAAALLLIPLLGTPVALAALAAGYLALLPPRVLDGGRAGRIALAVSGLAAALAAWLIVAPPALPTPSLPGGRLVATLDGPTSRASVTEDANGNRYLEVNGHFRMGGTSSRRSDWRQAQIPLLLHPDPHRALFLGVGTGATLSAAVRTPGLAVTGVELSPEVVALLPLFDDVRGESGPRPALPIVTADARRFVRADARRYDVIVADLFHPALDGSGALYTVEHFAAARARLAPGGVFCQWLPLHQLDLPSLRAVMRSFLRVFPDASAWLAHDSIQTPLLALVGGAPPTRLDPAALARRLADPSARPLSRWTGLREPIDLLGLYVAAAPALAAFAGDGPLNTDDAPFVTFDALRNVRALTADPAARLLALLAAVTPDSADLLGEAGAEPARRARFAAYWRARDRFLHAGAQVPPGLAGRALLDAAAPGLLDAVRISGDFDPAYQPLLGMAGSLLRDDPPAGRRLLQSLAEAAPARPEARRLLDTLPPP